MFVVSLVLVGFRSRCRVRSLVGRCARIGGFRERGAGMTRQNAIGPPGGQRYGCMRMRDGMRKRERVEPFAVQVTGICTPIRGIRVIPSV